MILLLELLLLVAIVVCMIMFAKFKKQHDLYVRLNEQYNNKKTHSASTTSSVVTGPNIIKCPKCGTRFIPNKHIMFEAGKFYCPTCINIIRL